MLQVTDPERLASTANEIPVKRIQARTATRTKAGIGPGAVARAVTGAQIRNGKIAQSIEPIETQKVSSVENVEEISTQLDSHPLVDWNRSGKRQIETVIRIALAGISRQVSVKRGEVHYAGVGSQGTATTWRK